MIKKKIFLFFYFILLVVFVFPQKIGELEVKFVYKKALAFIKKGEYEKAKENLLSILKVNPHIWEVYANLGYVFEHLLYWKEAREAYQKAITLLENTTNKENYKDFLQNNIVQISLKLGDSPQKWEQIAKRLSEKYKYNPHILDTYGYLLLLKGDPVAEQYLLKAIRFGNDSYSPYYHLGLYFFKKDDFSNAERYFKKAMEEISLAEGESIFVEYYRYLTARKLKHFNTARKLWDDFLIKKLDDIADNKELLSVSGYRKFYELLKEDLFCQTRLSILDGFYLSLRKRRDKNLVFNTEINLDDVVGFFLFKNLKDEPYLLDRGECRYWIDKDGKIYCKKHGYPFYDVEDMGTFFMDYYQKEDAYKEMLEKIAKLLPESQKESKRKAKN